MGGPVQGTAEAAEAAPGPGAARPRNHGLDILRVVSMCGVVAIHVFGLRVGAAPKEEQGWWMAVAIDISFIWVVPVFVMISGALILGSRLVVASPSAFYGKRAARLIPALIFWNAVYLIGVRLWMRHEELSAARILQLVYDSSVFTQLYFLWLILGLYAIAPVLASFVADKGRRRAAVTAATLLAVTVLAFAGSGLMSLFGVARPLSLNIFSYWLPYVGYFVAGYALRTVRLRGVGLVSAALGTVVMLAFTVWHFGHRGALPVLDALLPVSYLGAGVALAALGVFVVGLSVCEFLTVPARFAAALTAVSNASFGVFLVHLLIFELIRLNVPAVLEGTSFPAIAAAYAVTLVASFAVSLAAARIPLLNRVF